MAKMAQDNGNGITMAQNDYIYTYITKRINREYIRKEYILGRNITYTI